MKDIAGSMLSGKNNKNATVRCAWLMAAPAFFGLLLFIALPFAIAVVLSFTRYKLDSPLPLAFAGLEQFIRILSDAGFNRALLNNTVFAGVIVPLQTSTALALAMLLNKPLKGMVLFRTVFFMPVIFPMALVSVVWELIFAPGPNGLMNVFLHFLSFGNWQPVDFLHHEMLALPAVMLLSLWQGVGFQMVIMLAGLQAIPQTLYEAAALDGANSRQQFFHVTLPQLRNTLIFVALVTTILAFRLFDQIWILTQGGPNNATTTVMFEAVRTVFRRQDVARGAAMSAVFFLIVLVVTLVQRFFLRQEREME